MNAVRASCRAGCRMPALPATHLPAPCLARSAGAAADGNAGVSIHFSAPSAALIAGGNSGSCRPVLTVAGTAFEFTRHAGGSSISVVAVEKPAGGMSSSRAALASDRPAVPERGKTLLLPGAVDP
jgi:hypothetical protein